MKKPYYSLMLVAGVLMLAFSALSQAQTRPAGEKTLPIDDLRVFAEVFGPHQAGLRRAG